MRRRAALPKRISRLLTLAVDEEPEVLLALVLLELGLRDGLGLGHGVVCVMRVESEGRCGTAAWMERRRWWWHGKLRCTLRCE
jgi:hypothetical protein